MKKLQLDAKQFNVPESWEECTLKQQVCLAVVAITPPEEVARLQQEFAVVNLLSADPNWWAGLTLAPSQWAKLSKLAAFVWETKPKQIAQNYVTVSRLGIQKKYYLPDANLQKIAALDLAWLMVALVKIGTSKTDKDLNENLNELLGIAARPLRSAAELIRCNANPHWNGDRRQPASQHGTAHNSQQLSNLAYGYKCLIYLYIASLIEQFTEEFQCLFKEDTSAIQPAFPEGFGLEAHLRRVAKDGRFGIYEKVCDTNARIVWMNEVQLMLEAEAEIANMKKQNEQ